ncbi:uncharacterized protein (DUF4415 family) [Silvibacterium bohemicum]|uniref:Uncharacterized protein (DUF4415 family) n=1 Tax=Silvibacterium bohemicum TaxID=1577686 RepID=A0A841JWE4_9BACT|nr:BrnA antitoxin family protein [Silvibacterium bohemicum]MBB6142314.1 uncharacterized protein (DUF4415 family) [Silvibacterium bohemicum]
MKSKPTGTVKYTLDPANPPRMTPKQEARLLNMTDAEIDYSDIPPQHNKKDWTRPGALIPAENKQQITLRLDADVVSFFRKIGRRYQSRINAALREYVEAQKKAV